ncbi:hypothetical protein V8J36_02180 [Frigidibacter sp. MR17.14]|uniref:hypothetical protein n=1 Tax=Frigidibacter sp. MR17.14 TaxID=3126509 RepID=UPI0030130E7B
MKLNTLILSGVLVAAAGGAAFADGGEDSNDWGPAKPEMFRDRETSSLSTNLSTMSAPAGETLRVVAPDGSVVGTIQGSTYAPAN